MWIILDSRTDEFVDGGRRENGLPPSHRMKQLASLIIRIEEDDTYTIVKDRICDSPITTLPIEHLPNELKNRMIELLKQRDDVSTDD